MRCVLRRSLIRSQACNGKTFAVKSNTFLRQNHYDALKISKTATSAEIKAAYFELSKTCHPDLHKNDKAKEKDFVKINEAYSVLSNMKTREEYDASLSDFRYTDFRNRHNDTQYCKRRRYGYRQDYEQSYWDEHDYYDRQWQHRYEKYDYYKDYEVRKDLERRMTVRGFIMIFLLTCAILNDIRTDGMAFRRNEGIDHQWHVAATALEGIQDFQGGSSEKSSPRATKNMDDSPLIAETRKLD